MRVIRQDNLIRVFNEYVEIAYIKYGISGLESIIEFPSDWHEEARVWVRFGFGFCKLVFSFPWKWVVPDEYQCSGPTYGFNFFGDGLHLHWGKSKGRRDDPFTIINMPWAWRFIKHEILGDKEVHPYKYKLKSGEIQERTATIQKEARSWWRPWVPCYKKSVCIDVEFNDEVGERTGTWKGGTIGCGWEMLSDETPLMTLRRMEKERSF
jgi:hypothetical protein